MCWTSGSREARGREPPANAAFEVYAIRCILEPFASVAENDCLMRLSSPRFGTSVYVKNAPDTRDAENNSSRQRSCSGKNALLRRPNTITHDSI